MLSGGGLLRLLGLASALLLDSNLLDEGVLHGGTLALHLENLIGGGLLRW